MNEKIVKIHEGVTLGDEPVGHLVEVLERLLDDARSGDLRGFAYAGIRKEGVAVTGWSVDQFGPRFELGFSISLLQSRFFNDYQRGKDD